MTNSEALKLIAELRAECVAEANANTSMLEMVAKSTGSRFTRVEDRTAARLAVLATIVEALAQTLVEMQESK